MRDTEERMRALGLLTPLTVLALDDWEMPRERVVINRKLGEGAFGMVYGGEAFFDTRGWVSAAQQDLNAYLQNCKSFLLPRGFVKKNVSISPCQVAVAVKTLKSGSSVEEKVDFLSEANMMKRFDHRNIVQLLGVRQSA